MIRTILVPATGGAGDDVVVASALALARPFEAHLDFLHVRVDATAAAVAMTSDTGSGGLVGGLVARIEAEADEQEKRAKDLFDAFCAREKLAIAETPSGAPGPSAAWRREIGAEPYWIAEYGRAADILVVGRSPDGEGLGIETLEAALLDSGRPLLLVGVVALAGLPETMAIAWKPTREAAHAVAAAMPLLARAKRVVILTVAEDQRDANDATERLAASLRWHGVAVTLRRLDPTPAGAAEALLAAAREEGALLVMGGYGHSRVREWIFGGVTARVLRGTEVPVLIAH